MKVLAEKWKGNYLDYTKHTTDEIRIDVRYWFMLEEIKDQYITYEKDPRIVWNYVLNIGIRAVFNKIRSRLREKGRNRKYISLGLGQVVDEISKTGSSNGEWVVFLATNHPKCVDRLVVNRMFVLPWVYNPPSSQRTQLNYYSAVESEQLESFRAYQGWSEFSEINVNKTILNKQLLKAAKWIEFRIDEEPDLILTTERSSNICEKNINSVIEDSLTNKQLNGILFGLGNYAKTSIIPYINKNIRIVCVHEIDPLQIGNVSKYKINIDTSAYPRVNEKYDVYFIAGYHNTHTPIMIHALEQGRYAVVEKPIVTSRNQLVAVRKILKDCESHFFACFHKRYSQLNDWAFNDLEILKGEPVNYHCIVYEIPLPRYHWYNWPSSRSRITSNGCHWIDHFMFINDYSSPLEKEVKKLSNGEISIYVELENSAVFTMLLTDIGSKRLGVRDYIELRRGGTSVRMIDGSKYEAENNLKVIRRKRVNRMQSYQLMYQNISNKIIKKESGDSLKSLLSSELVIDLEELLQSQL